MIDLNYSKYDVLAIFRQQNPLKLNPTAAQIQKFDQDLFKDNEETLVRIMTEEGLPTTKGVKSTVLFYSDIGAGGLSQRVRSACMFYKNTMAI